MNKAKFIQTEIGLLPDDWEVNRIGNVSEIFGRIGFRGYTVEDLVDEGFGAITLSPSNIQNGKMDFSNCSYISWKKYDESPEIKIANGDILLVKTGSTYGKSAIVKNLTKKATINPQFVVIKKTKCNNELLGFLIQTPILQEQIEASIVGGAIPTLSQKQIASFKIPLSKSLAEQQRIAKALSDVDAVISTTEKLIKKKKNIKQGTMQNLLTGKKRLPGFGPQTKSPAFKQTELGPIPEDWEVKSLNLLGTILRGVSYKPEDASEKKINNYIPLLRSNNVFDSRINFSNLVYIKPHCVHKIQYMSYGDILICAANGSASLVGKNAYYNKTDTVTFGAFMSVFRCFENQNHSFIRYLFQTDLYKSYLKEILAGSAINNLTPKNLLNLSFSLPSSLHEQTAIANVLSSMDKEIETLNTKLEKYRNLKTAMMQQLLTGKIRLI